MNYSLNENHELSSCHLSTQEERSAVFIALFDIARLSPLTIDQMQEAVGAWVTVYGLAKKMQLAQALDALANLAPQLGLTEGLDGWEQLAQQMENAED